MLFLFVVYQTASFFYLLRFRFFGRTFLFSAQLFYISGKVELCHLLYDFRGKEVKLFFADVGYRESKFFFVDVAYRKN